MAIDDLYFRLRIAEGLKNRIAAAARANDRSMTAEIIARLSASFSGDDVNPDDAELVDVVADIERLKRRVIQLRQAKSS